MKTYGVYGMTEWIALIPAGQAKIRVPFSGGSISGYGVRPATFSTGNEHLCRIIENSEYYKIKKIERIK